MLEAVIVSKGIEEHNLIGAQRALRINEKRQQYTVIFHEAAMPFENV